MPPGNRRRREAARLVEPAEIQPPVDTQGIRGIGHGYEPVNSTRPIIAGGDSHCVTSNELLLFVPGRPLTRRLAHEILCRRECLFPECLTDEESADERWHEEVGLHDRIEDDV